MTLRGASQKARAQGRDELPGKINYLRGRDPKHWRTGIRTYAKVAYEDVYPGVDIVYYGNQRQLEYDFIVHPGSDPGRIVLDFAGPDLIDIDAQGDLVLHTPTGALRQRKPVIYQEVDGVRREIAGVYAMRGPRAIGFRVAAYDRSRPLVIDPVLVYSTYLGGNRDEAATAIAVDGDGTAHVTGVTYSADYPAAPGAFDSTLSGEQDVFITKLDANGSTLLYSTYLGGSDVDIGRGIVVDPTGNAYVIGETQSADFPTTPGAFDTTFTTSRQFPDAFVTKLDETGSMLRYSTYLGGSDADFGLGIAIDSAGNAYLTGFTGSSDFPTSPAAFDTGFNASNALEAFVTKLDPTGGSLLYSSYLGGSDTDQGRGVVVDTAGNAYVTGNTNSPDFPTSPGGFDTTFNGGNDVFVTKVDATGSALLYSTYLGGTRNDLANAIALDHPGNAHVTGLTLSMNFPTTPGAFDTTFNGGADVFVSRLDGTGATLGYSTYIGGGGTDQGFGIAIGSTGDAYIAGATDSTNFPPSAGAIDTTYNGGQDGFATKLNSTGTALSYSTYLGGGGFDAATGMALDSLGNAYLTGITGSSDFPTTQESFDTTFNGVTDAFVSKISDVGAPASVTLTPPAATNPVDTQHCVTATVRDAVGNRLSNVTVRFTVTGAVSISGTVTTDSNGDAVFCYQGPPLPGHDTITAFADTDNDGAQDAGEPGGVAAKTWVLPATTPLCEINIANGGRITAANGDTATFGGNAKADADGNTQGQEEYQDHGPAWPMNVHSLRVQAIVCESSTQASIYGEATIDGSGSFNYRIRVRDLGEPGVDRDTYGILLLNGYASGDRTLEGGDVQIRR